MPKDPDFINPFDRRCKTCGTDMRGIPLDAHCPGCGKPVAPKYLAYRVEGDTLIVKSPVTLPLRCIAPHATCTTQLSTIRH
jgi:hypothetical protein